MQQVKDRTADCCVFTAVSPKYSKYAGEQVLCAAVVATHPLPACDEVFVV